VIVWTERGGPPVTAPKGKGGFGSKLIVRGLKQIGGSIERSWQREGVVVTMTIKQDSLAR
jgi:two-component sensor histidine kinase